MITTDTVLVLGAGASMDFRFPSGIDLLYDICKISEGDGVWREICDAGHEPEDVSAFIESLRTSEWGSVDWHLEKAPNEVAVGKAAIAAVMLHRENQSTLFPPHATQNHWYRLLLNILDSDPGTFGQNRLAVVTFNYDRSLEHYLFTALSSPSRGRSESQVIDDLLSIEIVHVHGSLSPLPYAADGKGLPYGADQSGIE